MYECRKSSEKYGMKIRRTLVYLEEKKQKQKKIKSINTLETKPQKS